MSSDRHRKKLLSDILQAIVEIEMFLGDKRDFNDYKNNLLVKKAVERELEIVGEAMNRLLQSDEHIEITDAKKIISFRNRIIHGYDRVVDEVVWGVLNRHVPKLKSEVETLLKS